MELHQVLLALATGAVFSITGLLGLFGLRVTHAQRALAAALAAGILLATTFGDILPHAFEHLEPLTAALAIAIGFLTLFLIETATHAHMHHHDPHDGHDHRHDHAHQASLLAFAIGLGLHNLADGAALQAGQSLDTRSAITLASGIMLHQVPVGVSFGAVLALGGVSRARLLRLAIALGLAIPAGAVAAALLGGASEQLLDLLPAAAGGALLYLAAGHLLPEAQSEERTIKVGVVFSITLIVTLLLFGISGESH